VCASRLVRRLIGLVLCALIPCVPGTAGAQDGDGQRDSLPERIQRAAKGASARLKQVGLYPYVTSLATGGGAAPGLAYFDPKLGNGAVG